VLNLEYICRKFDDEPEVDGANGEAEDHDKEEDEEDKDKIQLVIPLYFSHQMSFWNSVTGR
jgi:hypothetical protein